MYPPSKQRNMSRYQAPSFQLTNFASFLHFQKHFLWQGKHLYVGVSQNGGTQQPWVFLLKNDHFGVWNWENPPFKETLIWPCFFFETIPTLADFHKRKFWMDWGEALGDIHYPKVCDWSLGSWAGKNHGKNYSKPKKFQTNHRVILPWNIQIWVNLSSTSCTVKETTGYERSMYIMQIQTRGEHLLQKNVLGGDMFHGQFRISRSSGCKNIWDFFPIFNSSSLNSEESSCCVVSPRFKASGEA